MSGELSFTALLTVNHYKLQLLTSKCSAVTSQSTTVLYSDITVNDSTVQ